MPTRISETRPFLQCFGVARALDGDLRGGRFDFAAIIGRQPDCRGADVLFQACQFCGTRDGDHPRLLGQQPREGDLRRCRPFLFRNPPQDIYDGLIRFASLGREARHDVPEVGAHKRRLLVDRAGQEALAEGTEWHESDAELLEGWQQLFFRAPPPQGVLALDRGDLLDGVGAADRAHAGFGHAEVLHLALCNQFLDRARHVLDRDVRVDTVLIIQIDDVGPESLQRTLDALLDALWAAVLDLLPAGITSDPELRGDHHLSAHRRQRFANELFVGVRTVDFGGIEECDAAFHGRADERDHRLLVRWDTVALAHPHAAEPQRRDFEVAFPKRAFFHRFSQVTLQCSFGLAGLTMSRVPDSSYTRVRSWPIRLRTSAPST